MTKLGKTYPSKLQKRLLVDKIYSEPVEVQPLTKEGAINTFGSLFDSLGSGIDKAMDILFRNGEDKLDRTFDSQEAEDFLKRFK